jgi:2-polyprenyl-3-methyl-5-hydroxy-6-metoxy-1,4-benzoquinol methylase
VSGWDALGPWITRFVVNGVTHGGTADLMNDYRIKLLMDTWPGQRTVLELGALEGAHAFTLAQEGYVVTAVEARELNLARAKWVQSQLGLDVHFILGDVERTPLVKWGTFDILLCSGILYHLSEPWKLMRQFRTVAPKLLLWTHFTTNPTETREGYAGAPYSEHGYDDSLSGMQPTSFWLTQNEILHLLEEDNWNITNLRVMESGELYAENGPCLLLTAEAL